MSTGRVPSSDWRHVGLSLQICPGAFGKVTRLALPGEGLLRRGLPGDELAGVACAPREHCRRRCLRGRRTTSSGMNDSPFPQRGEEGPALFVEGAITRQDCIAEKRDSRRICDAERATVCDDRRLQREWRGSQVDEIDARCEGLRASLLELEACARRNRARAQNGQVYIAVRSHGLATGRPEQIDCLNCGEFFPQQCDNAIQGIGIERRQREDRARQSPLRKVECRRPVRRTHLPVGGSVSGAERSPRPTFFGKSSCCDHSHGTGGWGAHAGCERRIYRARSPGSAPGRHRSYCRGGLDRG